MNQTDIDIAKKALNKIMDGDHHYFYLLDEFIRTVEKGMREENAKVPALLLRKT